MKICAYVKGVNDVSWNNKEAPTPNLGNLAEKVGLRSRKRVKIRSRATQREKIASRLINREKVESRSTDRQVGFGSTERERERETLG